MDGGLGGLGGIGGDDWNRALMGLAIMSDSMTPRTASNPHDMTKSLAPLMAMNAKQGEESAVAQALIAAGISPAQAYQMAKSPAAAGIMMKLREQQRSDSIIKGASDDFGRMFNGGGPSAPSGPAVPSIGGQKRSDINVPDAETPFHNLVMNAEGTAKGRGFNETLAYGKFTGGPVELTGMKVGDVLGLQQQMLRHPENSYNSSAAGGYQVVGKTLRSLVNQGVVSPEDTYDAKTQNKIASYLAMQRGPNVAGLRNEWEGLRNVPDDKILAAWQQSFGQGGPKQVASADPGFVPASSPPAAAPDAAGPPDWQNATATPEQFDQQLARARGEAPAPQAATQAPAAPPAPPLPIQRPPAPPPPTSHPGAAMGQPQGVPSIDPNSGDGGAKMFAASGMGRGGPFLTPPKPMALAGAPAAPAPVTSPVTPPAPTTAPAGPPSAGGAQVAQAPAQTATDAIPPPQQVLAQSQTLVQQDQAKAASGNLSREDAKRKAAAFVQLGLQYERAGVKIADNLKPFVEFYLDQAKPTEPERLAIARGLQEGTPEHRQFIKEFTDKRPDTQRNAEVAFPNDPSKQREVVGNSIPDTRTEAERRARIALQEPAVGNEMIRQSRATSAAPDDMETQKRMTSVSDFLGDIAKSAPKVAQRNADIDILARIVSKTPTGRTANARAFLDSVGKELGLSAGTLASQQEAIAAVTNRIAPTLRDPGSGAQSDSELRGFLASLPNVMATPGGNQLILATIKRAADIDRQRASIAARWQSGKIKANDARDQIADLDAKSIYANQQEKELVESLMGKAPQSGGTAGPGNWRILGVEP